jgi:hypothetical protein
MKVFVLLATVAAALAADWEVYANTGMTISIGVGFRKDTPTEGRFNVRNRFWRS